MSPGPELMKRLRDAVKLYNEAAQAHEAAGTNKASRAKEVGAVLIECRKSFPKVKDWESFLKAENLFSLSWSYEAIALADGRKSVEQKRADDAERQRQSRERKKLREETKTAKPKPEPELKPKPEPEPKSEPASVTEPMSQKEIPLEEVKAQMGALDGDDLDILPGLDRRPKSKTNPSELALQDFMAACDSCLPKLNKAHMLMANNHFMAVCNSLNKRAA